MKSLSLLLVLNEEPSLDFKLDKIETFMKTYIHQSS